MVQNDFVYDEDRVGFIEELGKIGDPSAIDSLIVVVNTDPEPMVRRCAFEALIKIWKKIFNDDFERLVP